MDPPSRRFRPALVAISLSAAIGHARFNAHSHRFPLRYRELDRACDDCRKPVSNHDLPISRTRENPDTDELSFRHSPAFEEQLLR